MASGCGYAAVTAGGLRRVDRKAIRMDLWHQPGLGFRSTVPRRRIPVLHEIPGDNRVSVRRRGVDRLGPMDFEHAVRELSLRLLPNRAELRMKGHRGDRLGW